MRVWGHPMMVQGLGAWPHLSQRRREREMARDLLANPLVSKVQVAVLPNCTVATCTRVHVHAYVYSGVKYIHVYIYMTCMLCVLVNR